MVYRVPEIVSDVRISLDENYSSAPLIDEGDVDTLALNELISSKIEEAARSVISSAPMWLLDGGRPFGDAIFWREGCAGWILLPDDFLRLVVFQMSDWERPVYEVISPADAEYAKQFSRCAGVRGNAQKPVVALTRRAEGLALEFFSCRSQDALISQATYIPLPKVDKQDGIVIPERCYKAVVNEAAAMVAAIINSNIQR